MSALSSMNDHAKHVVDTLSVGALVATLLDMIPQITAGLVLIWTLMRMYDSWLGIAEKRRLIKERKDAMGEALRRGYRRTLDEPVPEKIKVTLDKLK